MYQLIARGGEGYKTSSCLHRIWRSNPGYLSRGDTFTDAITTTVTASDARDTFPTAATHLHLNMASVKCQSLQDVVLGHYKLTRRKSEHDIYDKAFRRIQLSPILGGSRVNIHDSAHFPFSAHVGHGHEDLNLNQFRQEREAYFSHGDVRESLEGRLAVLMCSRLQDVIVVNCKCCLCVHTGRAPYLRQ